MADSWEAGGLVFVTGNKAFGIHSTGATICLGDWDKIKSSIEEGEPLPDGLNSDQADTIKRIIEIRTQVTQKNKQEEYDEHGRKFNGNQVRRRTSKPQRQNNKRTRLVHPSRYQRPDIRQLTARRKVTNSLLESHKSSL